MQGEVIAGRYEVLSPLGKGGMGMVYKAHDRMLDETVAIKVLRAEFANTAVTNGDGRCDRGLKTTIVKLEAWTRFR